MALFNAAAILADDETKETIELTCFRDKEQEIHPKLIVVVNNKTRRVSKQSLEKTNNVIGRRRDKKIEWKPINKPEVYCREVLDVAYVDTQDLFDDPSKKAFYALFVKFPDFPQWLASKLMDVFKGSEFSDDEEEDRKN